jgi:hypothetical protein
VRIASPPRANLAWAIVVTLAYGLATIVVWSVAGHGVGKGMTLAAHLLEGRLDIGSAFGTNDTVTIAGRTYWVAGPMTGIPYLPFVPFGGLWSPSRWIVSAAFGIGAAWLMLPLARAYGPGGSTTWWLAVLGAFGTLLFVMSVQGNDYYLTHAEAMLFTVIALIEWQGRRRPIIIGLALGLAGLARPPVLFVTIPFAIALSLGAPAALRRLIAFASPVALTVLISAAYNWGRFGSPLETGYGISTISPVLAARRAVGVFSISHVPDNIWLLVFRGFDFMPSFPYLVSDPRGQSILLTSPALLAAVGAGVRSRTPAMLWAATALVTAVLLLYYGEGGFRTYGYRYFLDATPFLLALTALAARRRFGALERLLIVMSVGFVSLGLILKAF